MRGSGAAGDNNTNTRRCSSSSQLTFEVKVHHVVQVQVLHAVCRLQRDVGAQPLVVDALRLMEVAP